MQRIFAAFPIKKLVTTVILLFTVTSCVIPSTFETNPRYNAKDLAKKWHDQTKKTPSYSIPGQYPTDNDADYYYPIYPVPTTPKAPDKPAVHKNPQNYVNPYVTVPQYPMDNDASNSYAYPKYDPDADNPAIGDPRSSGNQYNYPLFFDE